jgi:hypothetical protein
MTCHRLLVPLLLIASLAVPSVRSADAPTATAAPKVAAPPNRAAWMRDLRWGVMTHFLADWRAESDKEPRSVEHWNDLIDHFNVEAVAEQLKSVGAGWYLISIGQNSGYYLSPNATYDRITGITPSKLSHRDLVADLGAALAKRGIKLLVYLPSGGPGGDRVAREALQWQNGPHRNAEFQRNWEAIISEWSKRWGNKVAGWWFDGCYWPNTMYRTEEEPNFRSFAAAARAGNPEAIVAFNPGVVGRTISLTPHEDYLAGEISDLNLWSLKRNFDGIVDGAQIHVLTFLGTRWGQGVPRFKTDEVLAFSEKVVGAGGVITWDTPAQKDGTFAPEFLAQLKAINDSFSSAPQ